jgi:hypothetical protein
MWRVCWLWFLIELLNETTVFYVCIFHKIGLIVWGVNCIFRTTFVTAYKLSAVFSTVVLFCFSLLIFSFLWSKFILFHLIGHQEWYLFRHLSDIESRGEFSGAWRTNYEWLVVMLHRVILMNREGIDIWTICQCYNVWSMILLVSCIVGHFECEFPAACQTRFLLALMTKVLMFPKVRKFFLCVCV